MSLSGSREGSETERAEAELPATGHGLGHNPPPVSGLRTNAFERAVPATKSGNSRGPSDFRRTGGESWVKSDVAPSGRNQRGRAECADGNVDVHNWL